MGRMGWQAPRPKCRLLRTSGTVFPVRRPHADRRAGCDSAAAVPARPAAGSSAPRLARAAVGGAGGRGGRVRAVVRAAAAFLLWERAAAAGAVARARPVSAPDELHLVPLPCLREARLGGARRDRRLQRPRRAPSAEGGEGRAAGVDPALSLEAGAGRRARDRGAVRGARIRGDPRAAGAARNPRAGPPARGGRGGGGGTDT